MSERLRFTSVGYAFRARTADTASYAIEAVSAETDSDWTISGDHMYSALSGNVGIGSTNPTLGKLEVIAFSGPGVYAAASGAAGVLGFSADGQGVLGLTTTGHAGYFLGKVHVSDTVGIGTENPAAKLDVNGDINADSAYKIGGSTVLAAPDTQNTLVGIGAGLGNTGNEGTFVGWYAGYQNQGNINTFIGHLSGRDNTVGEYNTFVGNGAGLNNASGNFNTFLGERCGRDNTTGHWNTHVGQHAGGRNVEGSYNTFLGAGSAYSCTAGIGNVFIGYRAGWNETGSNKLYIANSDVDPPLVYGDFVLKSIGLGTITPSEETRLHVQATSDDFGVLVDAEGTSGTEIGLHTATSQYAGLAKNAYFDAGWWQRFNTSQGAYLEEVRPDGEVWFRVADAGANPISWTNALAIETDGYVGVGTTDPDYKLDVNGDINVAGSFNVKKGGTNYNHPDYVFEEAYELMPLDELKEYVRKNKSLPNVISAEDVKENDGFKMDELLIQMLEKIEEQTLYIFELEERIAKLEEAKQ
jgi:hypothetical protein